MGNVVEFSIKALDDFSATLGKLDTGLSTVQKTFLAVAAAYPVVKALEMTKASLENAEAMYFAAQRAQTSTENFSAMAYAAQMSNVDVSQLSMTMKFLGAAIAAGDTTSTGRQLLALGVSARDPHEALLQLADAFNQSANDVNKTAVAIELFKRGGTGMVPMLNQGSDAIRQMEEDARVLGQVISTDFGASADQVNDNLEIMGMLLKGSVNKAMSDMAPTLEGLTGQYIQWSKETDTVNQKSEVMVAGLKIIITTGLLVKDVFMEVGTAIGHVAGIFSTFATEGFSAGIAAMRRDDEEFAASMKKDWNGISDVWDESAISQAATEARALADRQKTQKSLQIVNEEQIKEQQRIQKAMDDTANAIRGHIIAFNMSADEAKVYELSLERLHGVTAQQLADLGRTATAQKDQTDAYKEEAKLVKDMETPYEGHIRKLKELENVQQKLGGTSEIIRKAIKNEAEEWNHAELQTLQYKKSVEQVMPAVIRMMKDAQNQMGSQAHQIAVIIDDAFKATAKATGKAVADAMVDGTSLMDAMSNILKNVLTNIIASYVEMQVQRVIFAMMGNETEATAATGKISTSSGLAFAAQYASVMSNVSYPYNLIAAPIAAEAAAVATMIGGMAYVGVGAIAHGGLDYVPKEQTYLLDKGERVLSPSQNNDLTKFLGGGASNGSGLTIQNLNIHVLENATNVDVFKGMDRITLRNTLGRPVVDALNEMFSIGVRPAYASSGR